MKKSVAMCTYNGSMYLQSQLESIVNQSEQVDEIIICDDCSTDDTVHIAENFLKDKGINYRIIKNINNLGFKNNFYQSISLCSGDIIFFCDQDDVWDKDKVKLMCDVFRTNEKALLVFSNADVTDQDLQTNGDLFVALSFRKEFMKNSKVQVEKLLADNFVTGATSAIRKELVELAKPYGEKWAHDYWFAVIAAMNNGLYCIDKKLIKYRQHSDNTIGILKGVSSDLIKRLFSKDTSNKKNRDNYYAELRIEILDYLLEFMKEKNTYAPYYSVVKNCYRFWKKREAFAVQGVFKNSGIVLKDAIHKEQYVYRNTDKPIIKDFIKGIALAHRDA